MKSEYYLRASVCASENNIYLQLILTSEGKQIV